MSSVRQAARVTSPPTPIGLRVRDARHRHGWSQTQLADRAGVGRAWIGKVESGTTAAPESSRLVALARALDADTHWLLTGETAPAGTLTIAVPAELAPTLRELARYPAPLVRYALAVLRALPLDAPVSSDNGHKEAYR
jgi:transcriptional regulator with XRE-family HTH domain